MNRLRPVLALSGLAFVVALAFWVGPETLMSMLVELRWAFPVLLGIGALKHILRVRAWQLALSAEGISIPFWSLLRVRVGAHSLAYLASMGGVLSEPLKPWLLRKHTAAAKTMAPTIVEAFFYWMTALLIIVVGVVAAVPLFDDATTSPTRSVALGVVAAAGLILLVLLRRRGVLRGIVRFLNNHTSLPSSWQTKLEQAVQIEEQIRSFRMRHPRVVAGIITLDLGVQVAMLAEVWIVLSAVSVAPTLLLVLAIEGASRIVKILTFYVPGRIGADEAGGAGSFLLLGLNPAAGLTLALARRAQALVWTALGMAWLARADEPRVGAKTAPSRWGEHVSSTRREDLASAPHLAARS